MSIRFVVTTCLAATVGLAGIVNTRAATPREVRPLMTLTGCLERAVADPGRLMLTHASTPADPEPGGTMAASGVYGLVVEAGLQLGGHVGHKIAATGWVVREAPQTERPRTGKPQPRTPEDERQPGDVRTRQERDFNPPTFFVKSVTILAPGCPA